MADAKDKKDKKDLDPNDLAPGIDPKWGVTVGELNYAPIDIQVKEYANLYETFEPASKAVDDAKLTIKTADTAVGNMAKMIVGRLRVSGVSHSVLCDLKRELRDYNIQTRRWK